MNAKKVLAYGMILVLCVLPLVSCQSDDSTTEKNLTGEITLSSYEIDFGEIQGVSQTGKSQTDDKEVVITLTNNSNKDLKGLKSSINFQGKAAVKFSFSKLEPGESVDVTFTYGPSTLEPGVYTGKATLTPLILLDNVSDPTEGEPIEVDLKATVI